MLYHPPIRKQNTEADQSRDHMTDKSKIKGGVVADDERHNEVERKGEGREECGKNAYVETLVHSPASLVFRTLMLPFTVRHACV
ncbi:hypothetical protein D9M72_477560 [compost metagenome]